MRRLKIGDRLLRVRDEGESKKPPGLFIHGAGSSSVVWMDAVRRLQTRRRILAPDLPGHGGSQARPHAHAAEFLGQWLLAFLRETCGPSMLPSRAE